MSMILFLLATIFPHQGIVALPEMTTWSLDETGERIFRLALDQPSPRIEDNQQAKETPSEVRTAMEHLARIEDTLNYVESLVERAKGEKDIIKLHCLNDRVAAIRAMVKLAESAVNTMKQEVAPGALEHNLEKISLLRQKARDLKQEAEDCRSEELEGPSRGP